MPGLAKAFKRGAAERNPKEKEERRRVRENRLALIALCISIAVGSALFWISLPPSASSPTREAPSRASRTVGELGGLRSPGRDAPSPLEQVPRLHAEAMASPGTGAYQRLLAVGLSRIGRAAVGALVDQAAEDGSREDGGGEGVAGLLGELQRTYESTVLLAVWDRLSALAAEATLAAGLDAPRDAGHMTLLEAEAMRRVVARAPVRSVCEVGFNAGHSAVAILLARPASSEERDLSGETRGPSGEAAPPPLSLLSIDIAEHPYVARAADLVRKLFPNSRFRFEKGDSLHVLQTLADRGEKCDLVRIDGGHLEGRPWEDLSAAARLASGPRLVWMDDVGCSNWNCEEPTRAWAEALRTGLVREEECSVEQPTHGFCLGVFA